MNLQSNRSIIPVAVFAYKRPDLLSQLLNCLKGEDIPLIYFYIDGVKDSKDENECKIVRELIENVNWCKKVVYCQKENIGLGESIKFGVSDVLSKHDSIIVFEDDLICVKGIYKYLSLALLNFKDEERVMSVTGWTHPQIIPNNITDQPYFDGKSECWGWGTWKRAWNGMEQSALEIYNSCVRKGINVEKYGTDMSKMAFEAEEKNLWAIGWWYLHLLNGGLCLRPPYSLIETTGWDGRGTTITPQMKKWMNPPLEKMAPQLISFPQPIENQECSILWKRAIDGSSLSRLEIISFNKDSLKKIGKEIWLVENILTKNECDSLLSVASFRGFIKAEYPEEFGRYNKEVLFENAGIFSLISSRITDVLKDYQDSCFQEGEITDMLEFYLYETGDFVSPHSDKTIRISDTVWSNYTLIIYLTENFKGGETNFPELDIKLLPKIGGAILFKQSILHESLKVLKGEKCILRFNLNVNFK